MNISCEIIRDLLPLYMDDVCSDDSRKAVENHLQGCEECSRELNFMRGEDTVVIAEELQTAQAVRKAWKKSKLRSVIVGLLIAAAIFSLGYGLTVPNIMTVDESHLEVGKVSRYENGNIRVELTVTDGKKHNHIRYRQVGDAFYITPMQPVIATDEDPEWVEQKNTGYHVIGSKVAGSALYVGWGDDAILVWEEGVELPPASTADQAEYDEMNRK